MNEEVKKTGMSKGCLIALIVAAVLIVLVIVAMITCYAKKDEIMKFGVTTLVAGVKQMIAENPIDGIDTVQVNSLSDRFTERLNSEEVDPERFSIFFQRIQNIATDKVVDSVEIIDLMDAMIEYYPDLEYNLETVEEIDSIAGEYEEVI
jgi:predicted permease